MRRLAHSTLLRSLHAERNSRVYVGTFDKVDARELSENAAVMTVLTYALADSAATAPR